MVRGVSVAIPTFNSEKWIESLIQTIQTSGLESNIDVEILVFDNASTDKTKDILDKIKKKTGLRIIHIQDHKKKSSTHSYKFIIENLEPKYEIIILSDHDDLWLPNKLSRIMELHKSNLNKNLPWLYCGTSLIWPPKTNQIKLRSAPGPRGKTHFRKSDLDSRKTAFEVAVSTHNMAFNRELLNKLRLNPLKEKAIANGVEFDNWLPFIASHVGIAIYDPIPTLLWRQHQTNSSGAFDDRSKFIWLLNRITRNIFLFKNGNFLKYISVFSLGVKLPQTTLHELWSIEIFEKLSKRIKLAMSPHWKHWNFFMDKYLRIRIVMLRKKSLTRIRKGL